MIKQLNQKPRGLFQKLPDHYMWFELYNKDGIYAYIGIEIISIWASFHTHIVRWSHNIAKSLKKDWKELIHICKELGVTKAIASNDDLNDKRWSKFIKLFGFPHPHPILMSEQEV